MNTKEKKSYGRPFAMLGLFRPSVSIASAHLPLDANSITADRWNYNEKSAIMRLVFKEKIKNDLFYVCSLVEYVGRKTNNKRGDIVAAMDDDCLKHHLEYADINHCLPFERVSDELIADCGIKNGDYDTITNCKYSIPTATSIGRVYSTLIESEMGRSDAPITTVADMLSPFRKVFSSFIIDEISDFANGVYFENPSYQWESYKAGRLLQ